MLFLKYEDNWLNMLICPLNGEDFIYSLYAIQIFDKTDIAVIEYQIFTEMSNPTLLVLYKKCVCACVSRCSASAAARTRRRWASARAARPSARTSTGTRPSALASRRATTTPRLPAITPPLLIHLLSTQLPLLTCNQILQSSL